MSLRFEQAPRWRLLGLAFLVLLVGLTVVPKAPPGAASHGGPHNRDCPEYESNYDDPRITWVELPPPAGSRLWYDVFFVDARRGWVAGDGIAFTVDGGLNWVRGALPPENTTTQFERVTFVDAQNGWALDQNPASILRTHNGGVTWQKQALPALVGDEWKPLFKDLSAVKVSEKFAEVRITGSSKKKSGDQKELGLLYTARQPLDEETDAVKYPWSIIPVDTGEGAGTRRVLTSLHFFDADKALATSHFTFPGRRTKADGAIFATKNGGRSWTLEFENPEDEAVLSNPSGTETSSGGFTFIARHESHGHALWYKDDYKSKYFSGKPNALGVRQWKRTGGDLKGTCQTWPTGSAFVDGPNCDETTGPGCNGIIGQNFDKTVMDAPMSMTTDGGGTWVPDIGADIASQGLDVRRFSYPVPTVAYAVMGGFIGAVGRFWKAAITLVEVDSIAPNPACAGSVVTIKGKGFTKKSSVSFGASQVPPEDVQYVSGQELKAKVPPRTGLETVQVTVTTPESAPGKGDQLGTSLPDPKNPHKSKFTYFGPVADPATGKVDPPTVTSLSRKEGKLAGGDEVVVSGTNLACAQSVVFRAPGGPSAVAGEMKVAQNTADPKKPHVSVKSPRWDHPPTTVDVVVVTPGPVAGAEIPSVAPPQEQVADDFTYLALPSLSAVSPPRGPAFGGTRVILSGTGLEGATELRFGDAAVPPPSFTVESPSRITATVPPNTVGPVPVTVSTPRRGASVASSAPSFTYHPGISGIFPPTGPIVGGTEVTIAGKGLAGTTEVRFGNDAVKFTERSDTELLAIAPPHGIPEAVPVRLTASELSSLPEDVFFTYGLVTPAEDGPQGDPGGGTIDEQPPAVQTAPPGGSPAASPSLSSAPSPVPSGSPVPGGAGAAGASAAPGASPGQASSSVNAPVGAALPVPLASPVAAPGAAGQGAPGSGQGAVGSEDDDEAQSARRYAMSDASAGLAIGTAGAAGCFSWLAVARRTSRRRRCSSAGRPSPKGAY